MSNITNNNMYASEQQSPIFSLSVSITGTKLTVDAEQLNIISSAINDSKECEKLLKNIQNCINQTYAEVTELLNNFLAELLGTNDIEVTNLYIQNFCVIINTVK